MQPSADAKLPPFGIGGEAKISQGPFGFLASHPRQRIDGQEGVDKALLVKPSLILMDMSLPVIDGWEATRRIKADPATKAIPVIALTAHAMAQDKEKAMAAGCDDFDTKPVDMQRLLGKIQRFLGGPAASA